MGTCRGARLVEHGDEGAVGSEGGDGLLAAGLPVLLVGVTTSPSAAAGLQVALMLPMLLLAVHSADT